MGPGGGSVTEIDRQSQTGEFFYQQAAQCTVHGLCRPFSSEAKGRVTRRDRNQPFKLVQNTSESQPEAWPDLFDNQSPALCSPSISVTIKGLPP